MASGVLVDVEVFAQHPLRVRHPWRGRRRDRYGGAGRDRRRGGQERRPVRRPRAGGLAGALRPGVRRRAAGLDRRGGRRRRSPARAPGTVTPRRWCRTPAWRRCGPVSESKSPRTNAPTSTRRADPMKIALDPYMFRSTPLARAAAPGRRARLRVHRAVAPGRLHPVLQAPAGGRRRPWPRSRRSWPRPESASPRCCRCSGGPARTRTTGRPPSGTGSVPSRSPPSSASTR